MVKFIQKAYYNNIFFEFITQDKSADTIVIFAGLPASYDKKAEMNFLYEKGYNVLFPRYPGTHQSRGAFLEANIVNEMNGFLEFVLKGSAMSLWDDSEFKFDTRQLILFGASFSGSLVCALAATNDSVKKIVNLSPVWDFERHNENEDEEDLNHLTSFMKRSFENLYRIEFDDLVEELSKVEEMKPEFYVPKIKDFPMLVFHDSDDEVVSIRHSGEMIKKLENSRLIKHSFGHSSMGDVLDTYWDEIAEFFRVTKRAL